MSGQVKLAAGVSIDTVADSVDMREVFAQIVRVLDYLAEIRRITLRLLSVRLRRARIAPAWDTCPRSLKLCDRLSLLPVGLIQRGYRILRC